MRAVAILFFTVVMTFLPLFNSYGKSIQEETFLRLDKIREEKKEQLFDYLKKIRKNAEAIKSDIPMLEFFHLKRKFYQLQKKTPPPEFLIQEIGKLKKNIRRHYLWNYLAFYDILFVDKNGDIFYTIRKQSDYHKNIFKGALAHTVLAKQLKKNPQQTFVDYQYYDVSGEPSAFFIVPVVKEENLAGWFIFQCAINKINNIFAQEEKLGATGEVFLVNKQNYMLTNSRFFGEDSILKQHLSNENIAGKFREKSGQKIVTDYRGFRVLSSFEVCHVADSEWLLISKIDENEIITEQYIEKRKEIRPKIIQRFKKLIPRSCDLLFDSREMVVVDMDEFQKVNNREILRTFGVSTCTAVIFSFPDKFSYMSHISNLDRIYGGNTTDLIGNILKRIRSFDIYKYEIRNLQITVVANHLDTIMNIIDRMVDEGIFLSQIKFIYNGNAIYANLIHDYVRNHTLVRWKMENESGDMLCQRASDVRTSAYLIKPFLDW